MTSDFLTLWQFFSAWIHYYLRRWTKPTTVSIIFGSLSDMQRSRTELIAENALLRQQLIVLNRQVKQPHLNHRDRIGLVLLSRFTKYWKQAIHIVQPETILRWHREWFRFYWKQKSKPIKKKPRISTETFHLIQQMANENRLWGAEQIRGELLKVGIRVSKRTIQ
jgi:putative transposase